MGIKGLLPVLNRVTAPKHLREYQGKVLSRHQRPYLTRACCVESGRGCVHLAASCNTWERRGTGNRERELCLGLPPLLPEHGENHAVLPGAVRLRATHPQVDMLLAHGLTLLLVFDGAPLPAKANKGTKNAVALTTLHMSPVYLHRGRARTKESRCSRACTATARARRRDWRQTAVGASRGCITGNGRTSHTRT
jgi:hypothetical protein